MEMKLVLSRNIENLGNVGDLVMVRAGYARNYLIPQKLAYPVTQENLRRIEAEKERIKQEELRQFNQLKGLADTLSTTSVTLEAKAEEGHLFGSVTGKMILDALRDQKQIELNPKAVRLEEPLKEIGVYDVLIHLHPDLEVTTKVWIVEARE
jgi:large subunit ribosomal protein L9